MADLLSLFRRRTAQPEGEKPLRVFAAVVDTSTGQIGLIEEGASLFDRVAATVMSPVWNDRTISQSLATPGSRSVPTVPGSPFQSGSRSNVSAYQWLTGTVLPSLRQRLLPDSSDFVEIVNRIEFYRKHLPWINRGLVLRAGASAQKFRIDVPGDTTDAKKQAEWTLELYRKLRMFSFTREFFWNLRGYGQVVPLWRTVRGGREPLAIECADPRVYQPRYNPADGSRPRIVAVPGNDPKIKHLIQDAQNPDQNKKARAVTELARYPQPILDIVMGTGTDRKTEVDAEDLEPWGFHFEYATLDRRHWEDWGFPGMYSIFPYLEMLMLADDADINALHHFKAGILLVTLGPTEPRAGDEALIASESELKSIDKKLAEMVKARLPGWAARGDLRIQWVVPPEHIMNPSKVASAKEKTLDWIGLPKPAWPGQDLGGAFASGLIALKFLQNDSEDERGIAKEFFEEWTYERAGTTNRFTGAIWPRAWFDPNALREERIVLELARLYMQYGGADEQSIAELFGNDAEVWLARRKAIKLLKKDYGVDFDPEFIPQKGGSAPATRPTGRPATVNQPTPERGVQPQPRPTTVAQAVQVAAEQFGISAADFEEALAAQITTSE